MEEAISLLPTLTPSQGLRNCVFTMKFLAQDTLHVNKKCAKIQVQKIYTKKSTHNLPICVVVRNNLKTY